MIVTILISDYYIYYKRIKTPFRNFALLTNHDVSEDKQTINLEWIKK